MNKKTLLLGAGASADAGIPTADQFMQRVEDHSSLVWDEEVTRTIEVALGGLRFTRPWGKVDVEALYQVLLDLNDRSKHPLAPFVGAWHQRVTDAERVDVTHSVNAMVDGLLSDLRGAVDSSSRARRVHLSDLGEFRRTAKIAAEAAAGGSNNFYLAALRVLALVQQYCWIEPGNAEKVDYLQPLFSAAPLWIGSLNYDNTVETAARTAGKAIDRGFQEDARTVRFNPESEIVLAKLHGSLDLAIRENGQISVTDSPQKKALPALIFGSGNKLRIAGPYLDLLLEFRNQLEQTEDLYVCGYSFRDTHINYTIYRWLEGGTSRRVCVSDAFMKSDDMSHNFASTIIEAEDELIKPIVRDRRARRQVGGDWWQKKFAVERKDAKGFFKDLANK